MDKIGQDPLNGVSQELNFVRVSSVEILDILQINKKSLIFCGSIFQSKLNKAESFIHFLEIVFIFSSDQNGSMSEVCFIIVLLAVLFKKSQPSSDFSFLQLKLDTCKKDFIIIFNIL